MTETERHLSDYIEKLKAERDAATERAATAEDEARCLHEQMEDDRYGWSTPRKWDEAGLPMPRLELHWQHTTEDRMNAVCWYLLVSKHFLGQVIAHPMGCTTIRGGSVPSFRRFGDQLDTPFRDGAHAKHDALLLKLPLCITTSDGDAVVVEEFDEQQWGTQRWVRRHATKDPTP